MLVLVLGGARSGKSRLAASLAQASGLPVSVLVTGEALDDEMRARIGAHRAARPPEWETVEEPLALESAVEGVEPGRTLIVDCLSLWVSNLLGAGADTASVTARSERGAAIAASRAGLTIAVSNEVGLGIVPATPLGRLYRDALGTVNRCWAAAAAETVLVVAGRVLRLEPDHELVDRIIATTTAR